jgi:hypothetical protein
MSDRARACRAALTQFLKDFAIVPRIVPSKTADACVDLVLALYRMSEAYAVVGRQGRPCGDRASARLPASLRLPDAAHSLTFEQFVDVMVLCAIAGFCRPQAAQAGVAFAGKVSDQAQRLWGHSSDAPVRVSQGLHLIGPALRGTNIGPLASMGRTCMLRRHTQPVHAFCAATSNLSELDAATSL